jgi:hypothetical protein
MLGTFRAEVEANERFVIKTVLEKIYRRSTEAAGFAYGPPSASLRKQPICCIVAKRRDGPISSFAVTQ